MKTKLLKILYIVFVSLSLLLCLFFTWVNGLESIENILGHDTLFNQMSNLPRIQIIWYSAAYFIPFLVLMTLLIYFLYKTKKKKVLVASVIVWVLALTEFYTDSLFHFSV